MRKPRLGRIERPLRVFRLRRATMYRRPSVKFLPGRMMRTRSAGRFGFESTSAQTGWRFRVRASITTTGDRLARLRLRLPIGGSFQRRGGGAGVGAGPPVVGSYPGVAPAGG